MYALDGSFLDTIEEVVLRARTLVPSSLDDLVTWTKTNLSGEPEAVTAIDIAVGQLLVEALLARYPGAAVVNEESSVDMRALDSDLCFVIDPIDGTQEFIKGSPHFSISVAVVSRRQVTHAVVLYPASGRILRARRGAGAMEGGQPLLRASWQGPQLRLGTSPKDTMSPRLIALRRDFAELGIHAIPALTPKVGAVLSGDVDVALSLSSVARLWDFAAIALIAREAGLAFTDLEGQDLLARLPAAHADGWIVADRSLLDAVLLRLQH